ncbi:MAG: hypothetical protein OEX04_00935 [Acidimicrobiia bacterium]|nr:hypothetical protein [Acidimicrobiia bacterium]MDH4306018.1 hypothetical protein [Acidimicrobiia bacterium]MDH5293293.1 hypothetical protein [Acidimicrobiia bacterium]
MDFPPDMVSAILKVAAIAGIAGIVGGLIGSLRASLFGSLLMGALGGLSLSAIVNIAGIDPFSDSVLMDAGAGFSYAWAAIGGAFLGYVVTKSSGSGRKNQRWRRS